MAQLNFTPEIEVLYMLFERSISFYLWYDISQTAYGIQYLNFQCERPTRVGCESCASQPETYSKLTDGVLSDDHDHGLGAEVGVVEGWRLELREQELVLQRPKGLQQRN